MAAEELYTIQTTPEHPFNAIHEFVAKWEGGLSDHPNDAGGITNYGVSLKFLTDFQRREPMFCQSLGIAAPPVAYTIRHLKKDTAKAIFYKEFWLNNRLSELPPAIASFLYDSSVNHGSSRAARFVQAACNSCNYNKLVVDGILGPKSRAAIKYDDPRLVGAALQQRHDFYLNLVKSKPSQQVFLNGWMNRVYDLKKFINNKYFPV